MLRALNGSDGAREKLTGGRPSCCPAAGCECLTYGSLEGLLHLREGGRLALRSRVRSTTPHE